MMTQEDFAKATTRLASLVPKEVNDGEASVLLSDMMDAYNATISTSTDITAANERLQLQNESLLNHNNYLARKIGTEVEPEKQVTIDKQPETVDLTDTIAHFA